MHSPAFCNNNLTLDSKYLATFSVGEVFLQAIDTGKLSVLTIEGTITSVNLLGGDLVATSTIGTSIFSADSKRLLSFFALQASGDPNIEEYHQGACLFNGDRLCVGHSDGSIDIFSVSSGRYTFSSSLPRDERASVESLYTLSTETAETLVSGHSDGTVYLWKSLGKQGLTIVNSLNTPDVTVSVCSLGRWLIAGFSSGLIRFWDTSDFSISVDLQAHARPLTALAVGFDLLASVAEDGVLNLWRLGDRFPFVENTVSQPVGNSALLGVGIDVIKNQVRISAYEQEVTSIALPRN